MIELTEHLWNALVLEKKNIYYLSTCFSFLLQEVIFLELIISVVLMPGLEKFKSRKIDAQTQSWIIRKIDCALHKDTFLHSGQQILCERAYRGSFLARTLASNFRPFLATYSASLSMTGWRSGGGGMIAAATCVELGWALFLELYSRELWDVKGRFIRLGNYINISSRIRKNLWWDIMVTFVIATCPDYVWTDRHWRLKLATTIR